MKFSFAAAGSLESIPGALHAETVALPTAVNCADQMGVCRVLFETDCLVLQQAVFVPCL